MPCRLDEQALHARLEQVDVDQSFAEERAAAQRAAHQAIVTQGDGTAAEAYDADALELERFRDASWRNADEYHGKADFAFLRAQDIFDGDEAELEGDEVEAALQVLLLSGFTQERCVRCVTLNAWKFEGCCDYCMM